MHQMYNPVQLNRQWIESIYGLYVQKLLSVPSAHQVAQTIYNKIVQQGFIPVMENLERIFVQNGAQQPWNQPQAESVINSTLQGLIYLEAATMGVVIPEYEGGYNYCCTMGTIQQQQPVQPLAMSGYNPVNHFGAIPPYQTVQPNMGYQPVQPMQPVTYGYPPPVQPYNINQHVIPMNVSSYTSHNPMFSPVVGTNLNNSPLNQFVADPTAMQKSDHLPLHGVMPDQYQFSNVSQPAPVAQFVNPEPVAPINKDFTPVELHDLSMDEIIPISETELTVNLVNFTREYDEPYLIKLGNIKRIISKAPQINNFEKVLKQLNTVTSIKQLARIVNTIRDEFRSKEVSDWITNYVTYTVESLWSNRYNSGNTTKQKSLPYLIYYDKLSAWFEKLSILEDVDAVVIARINSAFSCVAVEPDIVMQDTEAAIKDIIDLVILNIPVYTLWVPWETALSYNATTIQCNVEIEVINDLLDRVFQIIPSTNNFIDFYDLTLKRYRVHKCSLGKMSPSNYKFETYIE